jgi:hypothetical protein
VVVCVTHDDVDRPGDTVIELTGATVPATCS